MKNLTEMIEIIESVCPEFDKTPLLHFFESRQDFFQKLIEHFERNYNQFEAMIANKMCLFDDNDKTMMNFLNVISLIYSIFLLHLNEVFTMSDTKCISDVQTILRTRLLEILQSLKCTDCDAIFSHVRTQILSYRAPIRSARIHCFVCKTVQDLDLTTMSGKWLFANSSSDGPDKPRICMCLQCYYKQPHKRN
jgi:hypothetical protein